MRVALARILLMRPDAMLLDEPSNHLDLKSLIWLEAFLQNYEGALLMEAQGLLDILAIAPPATSTRRRAITGTSR